MNISIASGKGGTGKTTIATNLALALSENHSVQFLDCDVEEPNAQFFLHPQITETHPVSLPIPEIIDERCTYCGRCAEICAYNALAVLKNKVLIFPDLCHGCGGCTLLCPEQAVQEKNSRVGELELGWAQNIQFIHGKMDIGQVMAPPIIRSIKNLLNSTRTVIIDAPPGTSCPVIESVKGSDFSILVTEPTPFGFNDLRLAVQTLKKMGIPFGVVINRADIGDRTVQDYCEQENVPVLLSIPMDRNIAVAYSRGKPLVEVEPSFKEKFIKLYERVQNLQK